MAVRLSEANPKDEAELKSGPCSEFSETRPLAAGEQYESWVGSEKKGLSIESFEVAGGGFEPPTSGL